MLIVCFFFPPSPGIGGRRSAKFAKYLAKLGNEVHVIRAKSPFEAISPWQKDVSNITGIYQYELPIAYPVEFIIPPKTIVGKIKYRLYDYYFNIFHAAKNKYDYSFFWKKKYLKQAEEIIEKYAIKNILISGPPFYYAHETLKLKDRFPDLNIIVDFRDPWIGSPYYGMSSLKEKQQAFEINVFNDVFKKADYFTAPNTFLLNKQKEFVYKQNTSGAKLVEIPHAYDIDEVNSFIDQKNNNSQAKKIVLTYGGQLYPGTKETIMALAAFLDLLKKENNELYSRLEINFYTPETHQVDFFKTHQSIVNFSKPVGNEIMAKIAASDYCLIFLAEHNKDFKTTKFLEYSVLRKPFIVLGDKGYVAQFVEENKLGKAYDKNSISALRSLLEDPGDLIFNKEFNVSEYSFENVILKLQALLK